MSVKTEVLGFRQRNITETTALQLERNQDHLVRTTKLRTIYLVKEFSSHGFQE